MKLGYYGYYLSRYRKNYFFNIRKILFNFARLNNNKFKKVHFDEIDEDCYFFDAGFETFIMVLTKSHEIIKKIKEQGNPQDIYDDLERNEKLGFASYIKFDKDNCCYGLASTSGGPKNSYFIDFMDAFFKKIGKSDISFRSFALEESSNSTTIRNFPVIGKTILKIKKPNRLISDILGSLGCTESMEVDSLELTINPKPREGLNQDVAKKIIDNITTPGLQKYIIRAKRNIDDNFTDFYLTGKGHISDSISKNGEIEVLGQIRRKFSSNPNRLRVFNKLKLDINTSDINDLVSLKEYNDEDSFKTIFTSDN